MKNPSLFLWPMFFVMAQLSASEDETRFEKDLHRFRNVEMMGFVEFDISIATYTKDELNIPNSNGKTPLMRALEFTHLALFEALLKRGADPTVQVNGQDMLTLAFKEAYVQEWESCSLILDILKKKMEMVSEEDAFTYSLKQGICFSQREIDCMNGMVLCGAIEPKKNRDYKMVWNFFSRSRGCLTKGCKKD